jgi:hypothetical protein
LRVDSRSLDVDDDDDDDDDDDVVEESSMSEKSESKWED